MTRAELVSRFFEYVAPTGILKPGTKAVDGIFAGDDLDPHDFVGPDNAGYIGRSGSDALYYKLLVELHKADWMHEFCDNMGELRCLLSHPVGFSLFVRS